MAKNIDWLTIEGAYRAGVMTLRDMGAAYGASEAGIRKRAKACGWAQDPTGTKREIVRGLIAGLTTGSTQESAQEYAKRTIYLEADKDVQYMSDCLGVAVKAVGKLNSMIDSATEPRVIKTIVEANRTAMETIRRVRGLDEPETDGKTGLVGAIENLIDRLPN